MDRSEAKKFLPMFEAFAAGREIEFKTCDGDWVSIDNLAICYNEQAERYRIKPEPKLRPWRAEEVPIGCLIRLKSKPENMAMVTAVVNGRVKLGLLGEDEFGDHTPPHEKCEHSIDGGKTWLPCGVLEAQP